MRRVGLHVNGLSKRIELIWWGVLVVYSLYVLLSSRFASMSLLFLPFTFALPGYAFVSLFFPESSRMDKILVSLVGSLAVVVGLRSGIRLLGFQGIITEVTAAAFFSAICFSIRAGKILLETGSTRHS